MLEPVSPDFWAASTAQPSSPSPIEKLYNPAFRLDWDNDVSFHVAEHAIYLRQRRGKTQRDIAHAMGTSQPAIARIESGDENITLRTLRRLAQALGGRIRFSLEPQEFNLPQLPAWWTRSGSWLGSAKVWSLRAVAAQHTSDQSMLAAGWTSDRTNASIRELVSGKES